MPQRWLHNLIDIITHGKYLEEGSWKYHKWKDEPSQWLGKNHRILRHGDYKKIIGKLRGKGISVQADDPYQLLICISSLNVPEDFKCDREEIVGWVHEVIDCVWSSLPRDQRLCWTEVFRDVILNPAEYFKNKILEPEDLELREFKKLREYVKSKKIEELI